MSDGHKISLYLTSSIITKQAETVEEDGKVRNRGWKMLDGREAYLPIFEKLYTELNQQASIDGKITLFTDFFA